MGFTRIDDDMNIIANLTGTSKNNYGKTEAQMKAEFDKAGILLKAGIIDLTDQLEATTAADYIGCATAYGGNLASAIGQIFAAGSGTVPPDNAITTAKIQNLAVTEAKLATAVQSKLNLVGTAGIKIVYGSSVYVSDSTTISFGATFASAPIVVATVEYNDGNAGREVLNIVTKSTTGFIAKILEHNPSSIGGGHGTINWIAIGTLA